MFVCVHLPVVPDTVFEGRAIVSNSAAIATTVGQLVSSRGGGGGGIGVTPPLQVYILLFGIADLRTLRTPFTPFKSSPFRVPTLPGDDQLLLVVISLRCPSCTYLGLFCLLICLMLIEDNMLILLTVEIARIICVYNFFFAVMLVRTRQITFYVFKPPPPKF